MPSLERVDYAKVAQQLMDLHGQLLLSTGYTDAVYSAAKLCVREHKVQALLREVRLLRECPANHEDWDALCIAEAAVLESTP